MNFIFNHRNRQVLFYILALLILRVTLIQLLNHAEIKKNI